MVVGFNNGTGWEKILVAGCEENQFAPRLVFGDVNVAVMFDR
jgi:hypothetical protein